MKFYICNLLFVIFSKRIEYNPSTTCPFAYSVTEIAREINVHGKFQIVPDKKNLPGHFWPTFEEVIEKRGI